MVEPSVYRAPQVRGAEAEEVPSLLRPTHELPLTNRAQWSGMVVMVLGSLDMAAEEQSGFWRQKSWEALKTRFKLQVPEAKAASASTHWIGAD